MWASGIGYATETVGTVSAVAMASVVNESGSVIVYATCREMGCACAMGMASVLETEKETAWYGFSRQYGRKRCASSDVQAHMCLDI